MKTNEELLKENAELRASVYALRICVQNAVMNTNSLIDVAPIINTYNKTPAQHLADIKADAAISELEKLTWTIDNALGSEAAAFIEDYANKLRGDAK